MKYLLVLYLLVCGALTPIRAQFEDASASMTTVDATAIEPFPEKCLGVWQGMMYITNYGHVVDSVVVTFTAARTDTVGTYIWRTAYTSPKHNIVKDYKLILDDADEGRYMLDEGDDLKLYEYSVGDKLYCQYALDGSFYTSSTELVGDRLVFEVTVGKELNVSKNVTNYTCQHVQRVVMQKVD